MKLNKRQEEILELLKDNNGQIMQYVNGTAEVRLKSKFLTKTFFNCYTVGSLICFHIMERTFRVLLNGELIELDSRYSILYNISQKGKDYLRSQDK